MADLIYITGVSCFFGLCVAFVRGLDRIVGREEPAADDEEGASPTWTTS